MLEKLYKGLYEDGHFTGTFEDFQGKMQSSEYRKKLHAGIVKDGDFTGDFSTFESKFYTPSRRKSKVVTSTSTSSELKSSDNKYYIFGGDAPVSTEKTKDPLNFINFLPNKKEQAATLVEKYTEKEDEDKQEEKKEDLKIDPNILKFAPKNLPKSVEQKTRQNLNIPELTLEVTKNSEESVQAWLTENWGHLGAEVDGEFKGFTFNTAGYGTHGIRIIAPNGEESPYFSVDNWTDSGDIEVAEDMTNWIKDRAKIDKDTPLKAAQEEVAITQDQVENNLKNDIQLVEDYYEQKDNAAIAEKEQKQDDYILNDFTRNYDAPGTGTTGVNLNVYVPDILDDKGEVIERGGGASQGGDKNIYLSTEQTDDSYNYVEKKISDAKVQVAVKQLMDGDENPDFDPNKPESEDNPKRINKMTLKEATSDAIRIKEIVEGLDDKDPAVKEKVIETLTEESYVATIGKNVAELVKRFEGGVFTKGEQQKILEGLADKKLDELKSKDATFVREFNVLDGTVKDIDVKLGNLTKNRDKIMAEIKAITSKKYTSQEEVDKANNRLKELRLEAKKDGETYGDLLEQKKGLQGAAANLIKSQKELDLEEKDLEIFFDAIGRNYQAGTILGVTLLNATIDLGVGLEEFAYSFNPYVALFDYMDESEVPEVVKGLITAASYYIPPAGALATQALIATEGEQPNPYFDKTKPESEDNRRTISYRDALKNNIFNFQESLRDHIAEPMMMEDIASWGDAGLWAATQIAQQAPLLAMMYLTGGTSIGTLGRLGNISLAEGLIFASSTGSKLGSMRREMDMYGTKYSNLAMYSTAIMSGLGETLSERITLGQIQAMKGGLANPAAKLGFKNFLKKEVWSVDNLIYAGKDFLEEGGSEAIATINENMWSKYVAGEDVDIYDGVKESFVSGVLISSTFKVPGMYRAMTAPFKSKDTNQKVAENAARINKLEKMVSDPKTSPENQQQYLNEISELILESNKLIEQDVKRVDVMEDSEKADLMRIEKQNHFYRQRAENIERDDSLTKEQKKEEINRLREKVRENQGRKNAIIEKYPPQDVEKSYQDRMSWLQGTADMVSKMGGPTINIKETDTDGMMEYQVSREADEITYNQGLQKGMNEIINDPNSTPAEIAEAQEYLKAAKKQGRGISKSLNIFKGNAKNYGAMIPQFDADGNVTSYDLLINKETSLTDGMFNTAAHEFVHAAFFNTLKADPIAQSKLGGALIDVLQNDKNVSYTDKGMAIFNRRTAQYTEGEGKGEEFFAIASELMLDNEIEMTEAGFDKVKGIFRRFAQNNLGYDIKFDTPQDVKNFMIDYHKSVANNKPSKAIANLLIKGAKGKLVEGARSPQEIANQTAFSKAVELNVKSNPDLRTDIDVAVKNEDGTPKHKNNAEFKNSPEYTEGYMKITEGKLLDGLIQQGMIAQGVPPEALKEFTRKVKEKIGERYLTNYNLDKNDSLFGWLTGVSGGAGKSIIYRAKGDVMVQYTKEAAADQTSLDKPVGEAGTLGDILRDEKSTEMERIENEDMSPGRKDAYVNSPVPVLDQLELTDTKNEVDNKVDKIQKGKNKVNLDGLTYKGVKGLLVDAAKVDKNGKMKAPTKASDVKPTGALYSILETVANQIGVDPKRIIANQDLNAKQRKAVQQFLYNQIVNEDGSYNETFVKDVLPEGETRSGEATGIANTKLGLLYEKGGRARFAEGATAAGKATQTKRTDITMEELLGVFGINPDGSLQSGTASDGALRQAVLSITQLAANQSLRENALKNGTYSEAVIAQLGDGKAEFAWSKRDSRKQPATQEVISNGWGDLINEVASGTLTNKEIDDAVENVYGDTVKKATKNKIKKQILEDVGKFININKALKQGFETITAKNKAEFLIEQFEGRQIEQGLRKAFGTLLPKGLSIGNLAKDATSVTKQRAHLVSEAKSIINEFGPVKGLEMIISQLGPVYSDMAKIGDGSLTIEFPGGPVIINKDFVGPSQNRNQVTTGMPDFIALINKAGIEVRKKKGTKKYEANVDGKWTDLNTTLIPEDSEAFIKNKDFDARKQQAQDARDITQIMLDNAWKKVKNPNDSFNISDFALLTMSMGTSMKSPIRRSANAEYIQDGIEGIIAKGKKAGKAMKDIVRYEHMKSKEAVASEIITSYINSDKLNPSVWDGYQVQVISVTADNLMNDAGFKTRSTLDGSTRLFNEFTLNEIIRNPSKYNIDDISPIRSMDPAKQGTDTEVIGQRWTNIVKDVINNVNPDHSDMQTLGKATNGARSPIAWSKNTKGISVLDFDDTLATTKSLVRYTTPDGKTGTLNAEQYAKNYQDMLDKGYEFDFSEFNKVVKGKIAPLFQKALKLQGKFGSENMFVLTARPPAAQQAIFDFLKANGLNIPLKNITGLGNSTSEAKALWIAEKVGDGYNDFYFADDALQNVQAVKNMLDQFDVKSKVQQAKLQFSKNLNVEFNNMLEQTSGVLSEKTFSDAQARLRGRKAKYKGLIPPSAQDFMGLLYNFVGKGEVGNKQMEFLKKALVDPFARGINDLNTARQSAASDLKNIFKKFPKVKKLLNKKIEGLDYTYDQAIRVYLWNKAGFDVPGLSKRDLNALVNIVEADTNMVAFAESIGLISKKDDGYSEPGEHWLVESITSDLLSDGAIGDARAEHLAEWQENVDQMFSKENLNKIEAIYGFKFREALEDMLYRMKTGRNRPTGNSRLMNNYMNWLNNSVGAIMFFNMRSALLQTISATNYINWSFNNPIKAAAAFANQPQYWKDFVRLFNSDFLKQRRAGNQRGINEAELSAAIAGSTNKVKAALNWLLKKGFLPTQIADSFAIASGGATFFRNRTKALMKEGMTLEQAEKQAFLEFQETTEVAQQSARPDMISQQQASPLGRLILSFQNTPMQYARIMDKAARDLINRRGDSKTHISKIAYYGVVQSIIFGSLQSALFAALGEDEEEEYDMKKERILNGMVDSWLSGIGFGGKAISTVKNTTREYLKQRDKGYRADHAYTLLQVLGFSPPIGSKLRKIYSSIQTERFNRDVFLKRGLTIDNPIWSGIGNVIEGATNLPLGRMSQKLLNLDNAMDSNNEWWQRVALVLGWNTWDLGIKDPDIEAVKTEIKEEKKIEKKKKVEEKKIEKKKQVEEENKAKIEENKKKQKEEKKKDKKVICAAISKSGNRCKREVVSGKSFCTVHEKAEQRKDGKKSQCRKIKKNGKRCGMKTSSKSGYCYYHD